MVIKIYSHEWGLDVLYHSIHSHFRGLYYGLINIQGNFVDVRVVILLNITWFMGYVLPWDR